MSLCMHFSAYTNSCIYSYIHDIALVHTCFLFIGFAASITHVIKYPGFALCVGISKTDKNYEYICVWNMDFCDSNLFGR